MRCGLCAAEGEKNSWSNDCCAPGRLKTEYRLSVADCWIAALVVERKAILVHKDPEFEQIEAKLHVLKLPYQANL